MSTSNKNASASSCFNSAALIRSTVEPFLRNLFLDPDIIPLGPVNFIRGPLARFIAKKRSVPVAARYAQIGRRSPIGILTERQRVRLLKSLEPYIEPVAVTAMRYWKPLTEDAVAKIRTSSASTNSLLLAHPHYSYATTLSSLKEWRRVYGEPVDTLPERTIEDFYDHPLYIQALVTNIGKILRQFPDSSRIHLVFSAHGLPLSLVEKGDPYPRHVEETVRLVCEQGAKQFSHWPKIHLLCFQSKVGPRQDGSNPPSLALSSASATKASRRCWLFRSPLSPNTSKHSMKSISRAVPTPRRPGSSAFV